ncbi:MAG: ATP-dependent Clp protease adaptor ClpS [Planctomycetaceae bacterium]
MPEPIENDESIAVAEPFVRPKSDDQSKKHEQTRKQPPFAVIVENDDLHTFTYVIEVLQKVCGYSQQKAILLATHAHFSGEAVVWSGVLEVAELKRDQIRGFGTDRYAVKPVTFPLGVRIEPLAN